MQELNPRRVVIEGFGYFDHSGGNVDAHNLVVIRSQSPGEPAHSAAEIEGPAGGPIRQQSIQVLHLSPDRLASRLEKCLRVPAAVSHFRFGQDGPERILSCKTLPVGPGFLKTSRCGGSGHEVADEDMRISVFD